MTKKIIIAVIALITLFAVTGAVQAQSPSATANVNAYISQLQLLRSLRQGMTGEEVALLQTLLAAQPDIYPEGLVTGTYGPLTAKAVTKFQKANGLEQVGTVGPKTRQKLNMFLNQNISISGDSSATSTPPACVMVPPGHLIAPGFLKKHPPMNVMGSTTPGNASTSPSMRPCIKLPPGIAKKLPGFGTTTPPIIPPVTDTASPVISSLVASTVTASTSRIMWTTNEAATTKLMYGTSTPVVSASSTTVILSGLSLAHTVDLGNLATSTTYYFVAVSADAVGNSATSSQMSFTTLGL
ncbi:peptidoglycan-binding protein [Candidatus Parcubacteria bacterium]|nr:peptidoglycan-binding protein [Candidatus Parcubacteria bacterium]